METTVRTALVTAIAPAAWGSTYYVTQSFLPADRPLFGAAARALPIGLVLLAVTRRRPHGVWVWRILILGPLNIGAFFALIYLAATRLPGGLAATLTATSPIVMMLLAWPIIDERPRPVALLGAALGVTGVALLVLRSGFVVDPVGVLASLGAVGMASFGFVLVKRWRPPVNLIAFTSWQLVAGGLLLLPLALFVEGAPPALDLPALAGLAYLGVVSTGVAYAVWFRGLARLEAGAVALIGLVNPVVGTLIGVVLAHEALSWGQLAGIALVLTGIVTGQASATRPMVPSRPSGRQARQLMSR